MQRIQDKYGPILETPLPMCYLKFKINLSKKCKKINRMCGKRHFWTLKKKCLQNEISTISKLFFLFWPSSCLEYHTELDTIIILLRKPLQPAVFNTRQTQSKKKGKKIAVFSIGSTISYSAHTHIPPLATFFCTSDFSLCTGS